MLPNAGRTVTFRELKWCMANTADAPITFQLSPSPFTLKSPTLGDVKRKSVPTVMLVAENTDGSTHNTRERMAARVGRISSPQPQGTTARWAAGVAQATLDPNIVFDMLCSTH